MIAVWRTKKAESARVKYWEIIADNFSKAGWDWGCVSAVDSRGRIMSANQWHIVLSQANITLAIAVLGLALGILNLWLVWWRGRVRLRVVPKLYGGDFIWPETDEAFLKKYPVEPPRFCIEVQNLGLNAVTIGFVGFLKRHSKTVLAINNPIIKDGGKYPRRLEPHSSFVVFTRYTPREIEKKFGVPDCAFAETGSGLKFRGTSPVLKEIAKLTAD